MQQEIKIKNNYNNHRWRKLREEVMQRDNYQCTICGSFWEIFMNTQLEQRMYTKAKECIPKHLNLQVQVYGKEDI